MVEITKKVSDRLGTGIKTFQSVLVAAMSRDVCEVDAVTIIKHTLADVSPVVQLKQGW